MHESVSMNESELPLELCGFELNTARDVFALTRELDAMLALMLDSCGYIHMQEIRLSNGQTVDGWVKL